MASPPRPAGPVTVRVPEGDTLPRLVCEACGFIHYVNPKVVVGAVCTWRDEILLCRRAIEPRLGYWTIPAGYLELNETAVAGAVREIREEAQAEVEITALLAVYDIPRLSQVQLIYSARLLAPDMAPGLESLETRLFAWHDIPWSDMAFPSARWALQHHRQVGGAAVFAPHTNPPNETGEYRRDGS